MQIHSVERNTSHEIWIGNLIMVKVRIKIPEKLEIPESEY